MQLHTAGIVSAALARSSRLLCSAEFFTLCGNDHAHCHFSCHNQRTLVSPNLENSFALPHILFAFLGIRQREEVINLGVTTPNPSPTKNPGNAGIFFTRQPSPQNSIHPRHQSPRARAIAFIFLAKLVTQQCFFCADSGDQWGQKK